MFVVFALFYIFLFASPNSQGDLCVGWFVAIEFHDENEVQVHLMHHWNFDLSENLNLGMSSPWLITTSFDLLIHILCNLFKMFNLSNNDKQS